MALLHCVNQFASGLGGSGELFVHELWTHAFQQVIFCCSLTGACWPTLSLAGRGKGPIALWFASIEETRKLLAHTQIHTSTWNKCYPNEHQSHDSLCIRKSWGLLTTFCLWERIPGYDHPARKKTSMTPCARTPRRLRPALLLQMVRHLLIQSRPKSSDNLMTAIFLSCRRRKTNFAQCNRLWARDLKVSETPVELQRWYPELLHFHWPFVVANRSNIFAWDFVPWFVKLCPLTRWKSGNAESQIKTSQGRRLTTETGFQLKNQHFQKWQLVSSLASPGWPSQSHSQSQRSLVC